MVFVIGTIKEVVISMVLRMIMVKFITIGIIMGLS